MRPNTAVARKATDSLITLDLHQIFMLTHEAVVVGNLETGRIALWNPAAEGLFGWSAAEAVGQPIDRLLPPALVRLYRAGRELYPRNDGDSVELHRPFELSAVNALGEELCIEASLASLDTATLRGRYILALMRDVSERRRVELQRLQVAQVASARHDAERTIGRHAQAVQDSAAEMGRELRRLRRSTQRLKRHAGQTRAQRLEVQARVVEVRIERLARELDTLALRSALETSTLELNFERINLVPLLSQVVVRTRSRATAHKLHSALPQGLTALVDPERLELIVQLLLDQAVARCPRGCWIDVDLRRPLAGLARIEVRDFGRPVSSATRQRLVCGTSTDRRLALVRALVELHGGTLSFEFPDDGGVRAVVTLPTQRGRVLPNAR